MIQSQKLWFLIKMNLWFYVGCLNVYDVILVKMRYQDGRQASYTWLANTRFFLLQSYWIQYTLQLNAYLQSCILPPFVPCNINHGHTSSMSNGAQVSYQELTLGTNFPYWYQKWLSRWKMSQIYVPSRTLFWRGHKQGTIYIMKYTQ